MPRPHRFSRPVEGDIVVTAVSRAYAIGRITADNKTQALIETQAKRAAAFARARELAGAHHVYFSDPQTHRSVLIDNHGDATDAQYDNETDSQRFARLTRGWEQRLSPEQDPNPPTAQNRPRSR